MSSLSLTKTLTAEQRPDRGFDPNQPGRGINWIMVAHPVTYIFQRKDFLVTAIADNSGDLQLRISPEATDLTAQFPVGRSIYFRWWNNSTKQFTHVYSSVKSVTFSTHTLVTLNTLYSTISNQYGEMFVNTHLNYRLEVQVWKVGPSIASGSQLGTDSLTFFPNTRGEIIVDVRELLRAYMTPDIKHPGPSSQVYWDRNAHLPFYLKYREVWTGSSESLFSDFADDITYDSGCDKTAQAFTSRTGLGSYWGGSPNKVGWDPIQTYSFGGFTFPNGCWFYDGSDLEWNMNNSYNPTEQLAFQMVPTSGILKVTIVTTGTLSYSGNNADDTMEFIMDIYTRNSSGVDTLLKTEILDTKTYASSPDSSHTINKTVIIGQSSDSVNEGRWFNNISALRFRWRKNGGTSTIWSHQGLFTTLKVEVVNLFHALLGGRSLPSSNKYHPATAIGHIPFMLNNSDLIFDLASNGLFTSDISGWTNEQSENGGVNGDAWVWSSSNGGQAQVTQSPAGYSDRLTQVMTGEKLHYFRKGRRIAVQVSFDVDSGQDSDKVRQAIFSVSTGSDPDGGDARQSYVFHDKSYGGGLHTVRFEMVFERDYDRIEFQALSSVDNLTFNMRSVHVIPLADFLTKLKQPRWWRGWPFLLASIGIYRRVGGAGELSSHLLCERFDSAGASLGAARTIQFESVYASQPEDALILWNADGKGSTNPFVWSSAELAESTFIRIVQTNDQVGGGTYYYLTQMLDAYLYDECKNPVMLIARNSLGGILQWLFEISQEYTFDYQNGRKAKRLVLYAENLTTNEWEALQDFITLGDIYQESLYDLNPMGPTAAIQQSAYPEAGLFPYQSGAVEPAETVRTSVRIGQQAYIVDRDGSKTGVIVIPTKNKTTTKRERHSMTLEIEYPEVAAP